ncbi:MAG TPA: hypothetical protein VGN46_01705 [Luteibacter sp.]|jgi:hypothetical protein|uniref:hypothetical protein n=1 Tax=Luteibacter sp. TaxID=1886636 RepID=UPI002F3F4815
MKSLALFVPVLLVLTSGCVTRAARFDEHAFSAECGNTLRCKVTYADRVQIDETESQPPRSLRDDLFTRSWNGQSGIANFPGPAIVSWRSLDGDTHEAQIDMSSIFRDQIILHADPVEEVHDGRSYGDPVLLLVVNDRTLRVYMRSIVSVLSRSGSGIVTRHDSVLAYTATY